MAFLPTVPGLIFLFRTRETHVFEAAPSLVDLVRMFAPGWLLPVFLCFVPVALFVSTFSTPNRNPQNDVARWPVFLSISLGPIPLLILYGISTATSIHVCAPRYCMVALPGIALCWALVLARFRSRAMRLLFCIAAVGFSILSCVNGPFFMQHDVPWKCALEVAEKNASTGNAPVVMCSGFIESDFMRMPVGSAKTSFLFAPLSYYPLSVPVVPLPKNLNRETVRVGSAFLAQAAKKQERFLALVHFGSFDTLDWIEQRASAAYAFRKLWVSDGFEIVEFLPRGGRIKQRLAVSNR